MSRIIYAKDLIERCFDDMTFELDHKNELLEMNKRDALAYVEQYEEREECPVYALHFGVFDNRLYVSLF